MIKTGKTAAFLAVLAFAAAVAGRAQEEKPPPADVKDLLERIESLELQVELMQMEKEEAGATEAAPPAGGRAGARDRGGRAPAYGGTQSCGVSSGAIGSLGQTDRFSRTFNPAVSLVLDTIASWHTGSTTGANQDGFWFRAAEVGLTAQIDPFGYGYAVLEGSDGDHSGISVIEAAVVMNRLPARLSVKGGRFLADHGKFGQRHGHELPFFELPGVYYDYKGGNTQVTGAELHQWLGLTDTIPLRWSVGVYDEFEGHGHKLGAEHHHAADDFEKRRHWNNFAYNTRVTGYGDLSDTTSLQIGTSLLWAPEILEHAEGDTRRAIAGVDATWKWTDPSSRREFIAGAEGFLSNGRFFDEDANDFHDEDALGGYAWCEYAWDPHWAAGALADVHQLAEYSSAGQREYSAFITWKVSHYNWLRFQYRFNDLDRGPREHLTGDDHHEFVLQWMIVIGSHAHGIDW